MQIIRSIFGLKLSKDPLAGGFPACVDPGAFQLLDYWAWKYHYAVFYSDSCQIIQVHFAALFPVGIRAGLHLVSRWGFIKPAPRDLYLCLIQSHPPEFLAAKAEIPASQKRVLP